MCKRINSTLFCNTMDFFLRLNSVLMINLRLGFACAPVDMCQSGKVIFYNLWLTSIVYGEASLGASMKLLIYSMHAIYQQFHTCTN